MAFATRPKPTSQYKKRSGQHHRRSKPYLKAYLPYLPMLLIVIVGLAINSLWSSQSVLGASSNISVTGLLSDTNLDRANRNLSPLTLDQQLNDAAQSKANDMVQRNYWSHVSPNGQDPWSFLTAANYKYQAAGENLAYGFSNAEDVTFAWMSSAEHRANVLNANFQQAGFGIASSSNFMGSGSKTIIVAEYAEPTSSNSTAISQNPQTSTNEIAAQPVARIKLITGSSNSYGYMLVSAMAVGGLLVLLFRHSRILKRYIMKGEQYVVHHPSLDIILILIVTTGFILTRAAGIIR